MQNNVALTITLLWAGLVFGAAVLVVGDIYFW